MAKLSEVQQLLQDQRREAVARHMLRGFSLREIQGKLENDDKILNPDTRQPYSVETIRSDQAAIKRLWASSTKASVEAHRARQLAELGEIKREAWTAGNHGLVLQALSHESKLTDTAAPMRINIDLVSSLWSALERAGHNPETVFKAMISELVTAP
jgi:hypothetical protein